MKKIRPIRIATHGRAWKDFMNVHNKVRIPSPLLRSLTRRITRNSRKKLIEIPPLPPGYRRKVVLVFLYLIIKISSRNEIFVTVSYV